MKALIKTQKGTEVLNKSVQKKQALSLSSTWRQVPEIREKASALPSVNFTPSATGKACLHTQSVLDSGLDLNMMTPCTAS